MNNKLKCIEIYIIKIQNCVRLTLIRITKHDTLCVFKQLFTEHWIQIEGRIIFNNSQS